MWLSLNNKHCILSDFLRLLSWLGSGYSLYYSSLLSLI